MDKQKQLEHFKQKFNKFIKGHKCEAHKKGMSIICIDNNCQNRGLICSTCLTINGGHKNHDAVEIIQYVESCLKQVSQEKSVDQVLDLLARAQTVYDGLLNTLTQFLDNCSKIIKGYIAQRSELHELRKGSLSSESVIKNILDCKFESIYQANKLLNSMSSKYSINQIKRPEITNSSIEKAQDYINDIEYEACFIGKQLRKVEAHLKQFLVVKQSSPLVLNYEPTFHKPTIIQNNESVYIGEVKDSKPHGKGLCYLYNGERVVYGQFLNGKAEGLGELYYSTGDYYLGEFKGDKKNGRGVYRWNGKQYNVYQGQFKSGRRHGKGTFWWSDGSKYVGGFVEGQQVGYGKLYRTANEIEYDGNWVDGLFHGKGTQYFANGQKFEGEFKQDKFHGEGVLYKQNETIHGVWRQNELISVKKSS